MKPITLKIEGLNSFKSQQTVDFEQLGINNLFCISGKTGSGKTTIVDAIILALYGESKRGNLEEIINLSSQKALVELTIELEGEVYIISREIRRGSANNKATSKARIFKENGQIVAENATNVNAFIKDKIGLEKEQFTKVVMLQQGEFDKFLSDNKDKRLDTIKQLTDVSKYEKTRFLIDESKKSALHALNGEKNRLGEYLDVNDEIVEQKQKEIIEKTAKKEELSAEKDRLQKEVEILRNKFSLYEEFQKKEEKINVAKSDLLQVQKQKQELEKDKQKSDTYKQKLVNIEKELQENAQKQQVWAQCKGAVETLVSYEKDISDARAEYNVVNEEKKAKEKELESIQNEKQRMESAFGFCMEKAESEEQKAKDELLKINVDYSTWSNKKKEVENKQKDLAFKKKKFGEIKVQYEVLQRGVNALKDEVEKLKNQKQEKQALLDKMKNDNMVGAVLATVKVGDVCPICGNVVTSLSHVEQQDFAEVETQLKVIDKEFENAQKNLISNEKSLTGIVANYETFSDEIVKTEREIAETQKSMGAEITAEQVSKAKERSDGASRYSKLVSNFIKQKQIVEDKIKELEKRKEAGVQLRAKVDEAKKALEEKCGTSSAQQIDETLKSFQTSSDLLTKEKKTLEETIKDISAKEIQITEQEKSKSELLESLKKEHTYCEKVDKIQVENAGRLLKITDETLLSLSEETSALSEACRQLIARNEQRKNLNKSVEEKTKRYDILNELSSLFRGGAFTEFILDAFIEEITEQASERMEKLSSGQYTLYYEDGKFFVRDYFSGNAGRNVNTLSGGERFLASLSLAIAISRRTAQSKDYGFFFIDEGFGTLDENTIETVCASLENLSLDTMVGVITHRNELIERIPSVLEVRKEDSEAGSVCIMKA